MDQVLLLIRNPRWALPSYHSLIYEIHYAHDWETAYKYLHQTFVARAPLENWIKWRDYRFEDEINLWCWYETITCLQSKKLPFQQSVPHEFLLL